MSYEAKTPMPSARVVILAALWHQKLLCAPPIFLTDLLWE
jgi:hypothetical protein